MRPGVCWPVNSVNLTTPRVAQNPGGLPFTIRPATLFLLTVSAEKKSTHVQRGNSVLENGRQRRTFPAASASENVPLSPADAGSTRARMACLAGFQNENRANQTTAAPRRTGNAAATVNQMLLQNQVQACPIKPKWHREKYPNSWLQQR